MEDHNPIEVIKLIIQKLFNYLKEDRQLGAVTWITTIFATLSVAVLKFFSFVFESGKLKYWDISTSIINVAGDNVLYDIIVTMVLGAVVFFLFLIPYFIIKSKAKKVEKIIILLVIVLSLSVLFLFGSNAIAIIHTSFWTGIVAFLIADLFFVGMFFAPTIVFLIATKPQDNQSKPLTPKRAAILVVALVIVNILYFYGAGYWSVKTETGYRITTENYAIVYETEDSFYVAKFDESKNEIDKHQQMIISKEDVEYTWKANVRVK